MQNINWKKLLLIVIPLNFLAWVVPGVLLKVGIIRAEGFFGGLVMMAWIIYFAAGATLISTVIVVISVHENRLKHFFVALLCAILTHIVVYNIGLSWLRITQPVEEEQIKKDLIVSQAAFDEQIPLSIVEPAGGAKIVSPVTIVVHAKQGVLTCTTDGCGKVIIKKWSDNSIVGEGNLMIQRHLTPNGKNVYQTIISFDKPDKESSVFVGIEGFSGETVSI